VVGGWCPGGSWVVGGAREVGGWWLGSGGGSRVSW